MAALSSYRIIELAESVAGEYCGKLLSDFGAELIKVERPGTGSPTRALGPFAPRGKAGENSGLFAYLNTNKSSVTIDLESDAGKAMLATLLEKADAVIDDHAPGWLARFGLDADARKLKHPRLTVCAITPFGQDAPEDRAHATDLTVMHASGLGYHTPTGGVDAKPPLKGAGRFLASYEAGLDAALTTTACLIGAESQGKGRFIDLSMQQTVASRIDYVLSPMVAGDQDVGTGRTLYDLGGPAGIYPCQDGFIYIFMSAVSHWTAFRALAGEPEELRAFPDNWLERGLSPERLALTRKHLVRWLADIGKVEAAEIAQKVGITLVPVNNPSDLPQSIQLQHRGFFTEAEHPEIGTALYPTVPYKMSATPPVIARAAPLLGAHTDALLTGANA